MALLEKNIEKSILEFLRALGWFCWKNPTIGVFDAKKGTYRRPRSKFHIKGASDIIAIKNGVVIFLEVKTKTGKQTDNQKEFERCIKNKKGNYAIVRSVADTDLFIKSLAIPI